MTERLHRILAIDDVPANLLTLGAALGDCFELQIATSGAIGIAQALQSTPDLILLDVMMPEMDGYQALCILRAEPTTQDIPVIFVTAQNSPADEMRALEAGAADFISKPINPAVLRARIQTHLTLKRQADQLRAMVFVDGLTGVANRRQLDESLLNEWRACRRAQSPLTLMMIDIDHFKQFNDTYGHLAGDACLKAVAAAMNAGIGRSHDLLARFGGEEFVCLFPATDLIGARAKAEQLRLAVQALAIPHADSSVAPVVTVSIGSATTIPRAEYNVDPLLNCADDQLYQAKRSGRNRVCSTELQNG